MAWDPAILKYVPAGRVLPDRFMQMRLDSMKRNTLRFRPALSSALKYAPNAAAAEKCRRVMALYDQAFGPMTHPGTGEIRGCTDSCRKGIPQDQKGRHHYAPAAHEPRHLSRQIRPVFKRGLSNGRRVHCQSARNVMLRASAHLSAYVRVPEFYAERARFPCRWPNP